MLHIKNGDKIVFIKIEEAKLKYRNFTVTLREVCAGLSKRGIDNYIYENDDGVLVKFFNPEHITFPIIDFVNGGIRFQGYKGGVAPS